MSRLATTKLSSKGQVVIPEEIREVMGLHAGDQFIVLAEKDIVILKAITPPNMADYSGIIKKVRKSAKATGLTKADVKNAILDARKK